jgi:hypothetical protein
VVVGGVVVGGNAGRFVCTFSSALGLLGSAGVVGVPDPFPGTAGVAALGLRVCEVLPCAHDVAPERATMAAIAVLSASFFIVTPFY